MTAPPRRLTRWLRYATASALVAGATALGATAPASAASTPDPMAHPWADYMGSTIPADERTSSTGVSPNVAGLPGLDVSHFQGTVNWTTVKNQGAQFAYIKATEGTTFLDPQFSANYTNSFNAGLVRGAYHFAQPASSTGAAQADFFATHGGAWSSDSQTLPGMLDIENNPNGAECYGLSQASMRSWISSFLNEYHARTGRWATIYTTTSWWTTCTGNTSAFAANDPLAIAHFASTVGALPAGWGFYTFWQFADSGIFPGDQDVFNGNHDRLIALANNTA